MLYWRLMYGLLSAILLSSLRFSVTAISCILCGNRGPENDTLLMQNQTLAYDPLCNLFADASELMKFASPCPADANACYSVGFSQQSDGDLAVRGCVKWPTADQKNLTCRVDVAPTIWRACPCYTDYCNVASQTKGNVTGVVGLVGVLRFNQTDRCNMATGGTCPTDGGNANQAGGSLPLGTSNIGTTGSSGSGGNSLLHPSSTFPAIIIVISFATLSSVL